MKLIAAFLALLVLVLLGLAVLVVRDRRADRVEWARLAALQPGEPGVFDPAMVAEVPEPARRYFAFAIAPGTPLWTVAEIGMTGRFGLGTKEDPRYQPMAARQILAAPEGFVWAMRSTGGLPVAGSDSGAWTRFRILGLIPVARAGGDADHARSAFGRYVSEAVIWTPAAVLPGPGVAWEAVDGDTARVTVTRGELSQAVDVRVDAEGRPQVVSFERWTNANPEKAYRLQPFGAVVSDFRDVGGFRLPFHAEAGNMFGTEDYFPFFVADVSAIRFPGARAMTAVILGFQVALPLALLAWLLFLPAGSLAGFVLQAAGPGAMLFALARVAQWALPVWWLPWVYGALWLGLVVVRAAGLRGPVWPGGAWGWAGLVLSVVLCAVGGWYGARAVMGRSAPPVEVVDIANPFGPGRYLVGNGGSTVAVNVHLKTLDPGVERFQPWRGQSYALDFFGLGPWGLRATGWRPADPAAYAIFGAELRAPCAGGVVAAEGGKPDFEVPEQDEVNRLGNHVILRCGEAWIVFAHMRNGSVDVAPGERVAVGDRLGAVGNSGASTEPHLHIHAQRPAEEGAPPLSGDPLGLRIDGRFLVRGDRLAGRD